MADKKGDDKKAAAKADKKGGDDKKKAEKADKPKGGDDKKKADKKADASADAKPKAGGDDKKGGDKPKGEKKEKAAKADDKPKGDDKPKAAAAAEDGKDAAAAPAAAGAGAGDEKKGKGKKEKKEKADGEKKADGKDAPVVEAQELSHVDPNKPVEKPNKDQLDNDVKALEKVVKEIESTITRLSQQLEAKNAERTKLRSSKNELFEEGKKIKEEREKKDVQVRNLTTKIEEIIAERKNNRQRLDATAKSLRYTNLDELEKAITQTELRIATSSLSLAAEKQLIAELKLLKAQRVEVAKFAAEKQKVNTVNAAKTDELKAGDVREKRDELRKQATALFKLEKEAFEKFSAAKSKDNELKRECDALADKRRTNLKDKKTFVDKIYAMKREFVAADRAYYKWLQRQKKDKASANRARAREDRPSAGMEGAVGGSAPQQHQVAFVDTNRPAAGMGNRRAKKEKAAGADDNKPARKKNTSAGPDGDDDEPVIEEIEDLTDIVPYAAEKALCDKLVRYVTALQGKFRSADDAKDEKAKDEKKADHVLVDDRNKGFKGKPVGAALVSKKGKGSDKLEDFFGKDVSKSQDISSKPKKAAAAAVIDLKGGDAKVVQPTDKKAAARAAAKKQKLTHVPDVFTEFKALGLTAPVEVGQLEGALKALVEKKAYFESNPAADEVEAAVAAPAGDAAEAPVDTAAAADKAMDEEKAARVKEAEDLKAAAAKIGAEERKKAAKAADAAAEAERLRRVAEDAKAKKENADEENKERQRRKSLASEAEDAEQKRRVEEDAKAKSAADAEEAKTRATGRRNSLQAQDEEQKRRIAAGEDHHDKPSVVAQVDAAEKKAPKGKKEKGDKKGKGKKDDAKADKAAAADAKAAPAPKADAAPAAAAAAPAAAAAAPAAGAAVGAELVKKVDADLTKAGFEPFTNAPASS